MSSGSNSSMGRLFVALGGEILSELFRECSRTTQLTLALYVGDELVVLSTNDSTAAATHGNAWIADDSRVPRSAARLTGAPGLITRAALSTTDLRDLTIAVFSRKPQSPGNPPMMVLRDEPEFRSAEWVTSMFVPITRVLLERVIERYVLTKNLLHEVGTGLAAAAGAAEYIGLRTSTDAWLSTRKSREQILWNVDTVHSQLHLATALTSSLVDYYSPETSAPVRLERRQLNLTEVLNEVTRAWELVAKGRGIEIRMGTLERFTVPGNPVQLRQLFHNVISNAVKYSYATSETTETRFVGVAVRQHDPGFVGTPRVLVEISNYGIGISSEERAKLGQFGFRGRMAREEQPIGLGIGVYSAMRIARSHGGEVKYESRYLHNTIRTVRGRAVESQTYKTTCSVILPTSRR